MTRVVLGSASAGRRKVLRAAGIDPIVIVSGVDEDAVVATLAPGAGPGEVTGALAAAKARAVVAALPVELAADCVVIGCDSMLLHDGRLRGKPASEADALAEWRGMAGTAGELFTGHCVIRVRGDEVIGEYLAHAQTVVEFGTPTEDELAAYVASGEPIGVAGAFTIDGLGGWFVDGVRGDPSAVIGIGLPLLKTLLGRAGLSIPDLWAANPVH